MLPKLQYNFTNWVDGMKINRQHFIDSENAVADQLRDVLAMNLHSANYGLLQPLPGEKSALECNVVSMQSKQLKVTVSYCRAITSGGCRVEILPGIHQQLTSENISLPENELNGKPSGSGFLAVISVDPYNRQPFGVAAADEHPPRNRFAISQYKLNLVNEEHINTGSIGAYHIPVARFLFKQGDLVHDTSYIPPCAVLSAHPITRQIYNDVAERLNQIQEHSSEIIKKVVEQAQNNALAQNVRKLCEGCIRHISSEFFFYRSLYGQQSPIYVGNCVVRLASIIAVELKLLPAKEKEEILQYFNHWNEISPGQFEEQLGAVINADYDHEHIYDFFQPLILLLKTWSDLLEKLGGLKLIGEKKGGFDFGGRTMETPKEKGKGRISIFD